MKSRKSLTMVLAVSLIVLILPATAMSAGVSVECAYTATDVVCEAYADTTGTDGLRSAGVQLTTTNCTAVSATKNTNVWFFGDAAPGTDYPNSPDLSDQKAPNLIVGQLDTSASPTVVTGTRVKMGSVTFTRDDTSLPDITAELARGGGSFVSFVDAVSGAPLDGSVAISTTVAERGDANADGSINVLDLRALRQNVANPAASPWVDCNGDGVVNVLDIRCLRQKI